MFLGKAVLKICSKFTGEHPCRSAILVKLQSNFIEITLRYGCSPVNLLHIFRTPFPRNTSERLLLEDIAFNAYFVQKNFFNICVLPQYIVYQIYFQNGEPSCYLEFLDKLQKRICRTVGPSIAASLEFLGHCRNVASLSLF